MLAPLRFAFGLALFCLSADWIAFADEPAATANTTAADQKKADLLKVPDEPRTVDPVTIVPELVAKKGTVKFEGASLLDVAKWLREEMQIPVLFEQQTINYSLEFGATVNDRLNDAPVYQLLDRLALHKLSWHVEDGVVYLVGQAEADKRMITTSYNLSDLLDAGYRPEAITRTISTTIRGNWNNSSHAGNSGSLVWLGDVLFVRQTHELHRHVLGLLQALRKHGRRTFIYDPMEHESLRAQLEQRVTVDIVKTPLEQAIRELSEKHQIDLRFDQTTIDKLGNSLRTPVTLKLNNQKLQTVLTGLLRDFGLTVELEYGIASIMPHAVASTQYKTAVYYVNDLCQTNEETFALLQAIKEQTAGEALWKAGDYGVIDFSRVGTMVILQREPVHNLIVSLLENYRIALRQSKPRSVPGSDPKEVIVHYYRMHADMAPGLLLLLPSLIEPGSWKDEQHPDAVGEVQILNSRPDFTDENSDVSSPTPIPHVVLIVKHRREVHTQIEQAIYRVTYGDEDERSSGSGQQGFGQGFF